MRRASTYQARDLAELLLQLGRAAYADGAGGDLTAAQWAALRYFGRANRFSRTVSAFASYHATTRGTASQTIRSLVERGYLRRMPSQRDGRSVLFAVTESARRRLQEDPLESLVRAAAQLEDASLDGVARELRRVGEYLGAERGEAVAGRCQHCGHLLKSGGDYRCGLMDEALDREEISEICMRYRARPDARGGR